MIRLMGAVLVAAGGAYLGFQAAAGLRKRGRAVRQMEEGLALLERELRLKRWEMRPEGELRIYEAVDTKAVGRLLTQAGISIEEMGLHRQDLEAYFLERMGGSDHV